MAFRPTLGQRDRLVQRVMRHRRLATLFRVPEAPARAVYEATGVPYRSQEPGEGYPLQDVLSPPEPDRVRAAAPVPAARDPWATGHSGESGRTVPGYVAPRPAGTMPVAPSSVTARPQRQIQESGPEIPQRTEQPAETLPEQAPAVAPPSSDESTTSDEVWRRLTTIFRRHQEKAADDATGESATSGGHDASAQARALTTPGETGESEPNEVLPGVGKPAHDTGALEAGGDPRQSPTDPTSPPAARRPAIMEGGAGRATPGTEARDRGAPAHVQRALSGQATLAAPVGIDARRQDPAPDARHPALSIQPGADLHTQAAGPDVPGNEPRLPVQGPDSTAALPEGTPPAEGLSPGAAIPEPMLEGSGARPQPHPVGVVSSGPVRPAAARPAEVPLEEVALETVWQVERLREATREPAAAPEGHVEAQNAPGSGAVRPSPGQHPAARIGPGTGPAAPPTRSSIEILPPRRPRPQVDVRRQTVGARADETGAVEAPVPAAGRPVPAAGRPVPAAGPTDPAAGRTAPAAAPSLVQTDVGPLPSDLWTLIGEPVPEAAGAVLQQDRTPAPQPAAETSSRPAAPEPRAAATGSRLPETAQPRSGLAPETGVAPAQPQSAQGAAAPEKMNATKRDLPPAGGNPAQIQREMQIDELVANVAPGTLHTEAEDETEEPREREPTGGGLDLEELARRVYADVRRRLSLEIERARGR